MESQIKEKLITKSGNFIRKPWYFEPSLPEVRGSKLSLLGITEDKKNVLHEKMLRTIILVHEGEITEQEAITECSQFAETIGECIAIVDSITEVLARHERAIISDDEVKRIDEYQRKSQGLA